MSSLSSFKPAQVANVRYYTAEEIRQHAHDGDCWVVVQDHVYDVTQALAKHPPGKGQILTHAGKDATYPYRMFHDGVDKQARLLAPYYQGAITPEELQKLHAYDPMPEETKKFYERFLKLFGAKS